MINKQLLLDKLVDNQIEGVLGKSLTSVIEKNGYKIQMGEDVNWLELINPNGKLLLDDVPNYITEFTPELLDRKFTSILIGGLGLGIIPFVVQDFCTTIDVIEINTDIIDINRELDALGSNVNIIEGDVYTFQPTKMYDIIVMDIWWRKINDDVINTLNSMYLPFVNEGGFIYYPINQPFNGKDTNTYIVYK
jgi:hypothetical protein